MNRRGLLVGLAAFASLVTFTKLPLKRARRWQLIRRRMGNDVVYEIRTGDTVMQAGDKIRVEARGHEFTAALNGEPVDLVVAEGDAWGYGDFKSTEDRRS